MKYGKFNLGQIEALLNKLGEENVERLLQDRLTVRFEGFIEERSLFRFDGWAKQDGLVAAMGSGLDGDCTGFENFDMHSTKALKSRLWRLSKFLNLDDSVIALENFLARIETLRIKIQKDSRIAHILNGPYLPVVIPKVHFANPSGNKDLINDLGNAFSKAVKEQYPVREYNEHPINNLRVVTSHTNQGYLFEKLAKDSVVGLFFPEALAQFSVNAAKEFVGAHLPEGFVLSGIDGLVASIMYADILLPKEDHAWNLNFPGLGTDDDSYFALQPREESLAVSIDNDTETGFNFETQGLLYIG